MRAGRLLIGAASLPLLPVTMVRAALDAPRAAARHPSSQELRRLLDAGYTVTGYRKGRAYDPVQVSLARGDATAAVTSSDLAFAAYAAKTVPGAVNRATRRLQRSLLGFK